MGVFFTISASTANRPIHQYTTHKKPGRNRNVRNFPRDYIERYSDNSKHSRISKKKVINLIMFFPPLSLYRLGSINQSFMLFRCSERVAHSFLCFGTHAKSQHLVFFVGQKQTPTIFRPTFPPLELWTPDPRNPSAIIWFSGVPAANEPMIRLLVRTNRPIKK